MDIIRMVEFPNLVFTSRFYKDLNKILKGYSNAKAFEKWLLARLSQLNEPDFNYNEYPNWFEPINDLFVITYRHREKNIRMFYSVEGGTVKLLLCSFDEKKKADYTLGYNAAKGMLKNVRRELL